MSRILIIEDEPLIAMMLEDFVESLDHESAGTVDNVDDALEMVVKGGFDCAILDVNLRDGQPSWAVADALEDAGKPFAFASGGEIGGAPERHSNRPFLAKPFTLDGVKRVFDGELAK